MIERSQAEQEEHANLDAARLSKSVALTSEYSIDQRVGALVNAYLKLAVQNEWLTDIFYRGQRLAFYASRADLDSESKELADDFIEIARLSQVK